MQPFARNVIFLSAGNLLALGAGLTRMKYTFSLSTGAGWLIALGVLVFQAGCIGDDILQDAVEPVLRITNPIDTLELGGQHPFAYAYFDQIGRPQDVDVVWSSSAPEVISISSGGIAEGLQAGSALIRVTFNGPDGELTDARSVAVGARTVGSQTLRSGTIETTSSYLLRGDFELEETAPETLELRFADNYAASTALPGLYVYLTNNPETSVGALEISRVSVFSGAHSYTITGTGLRDYGYVLFYCKPFNVKIGDGAIND